MAGFFKQFFGSIIKLIQAMAKDDAVRKAMDTILEMLGMKEEETAE